MNGFWNVFVTVLRLFMKVFKHLKQSPTMSVVMTVACVFTYLYAWNLHSFYIKKISSMDVLLWCQNMPSLSPNIEWFVNKKGRERVRYILNGYHKYIYTLKYLFIGLLMRISLFSHGQLYKKEKS